MAPHSSTLAWKIPWTEAPGRLRSMGSLRVRHDCETSLSLFTFHFHALEKEMATHSSVLACRIPRTGEPGGLPSMGSHRWTRLKRLSNSSQIFKISSEFLTYKTKQCLLCSVVSDSLQPFGLCPHAPLSTRFFRQEYWGVLPSPPPEDLPNPGTEPASPASPALQEGSSLLSHRGSPNKTLKNLKLL